MSLSESHRDLHSAAASTSGRRVWWIAFAAALALFTLTLAPDVLMMDSGEYQCAVHQFPRLDLGDRPADLVRIHPVYLAVAKVISFVPIGNHAWRVNFTSALFGALAVANATLLAFRLTRQRAAAALAALVLAFGHTLWAFSVIAEVMSMLAALVTFELLCWWDYGATKRPGPLMVLAAVNGLAVATHLQMGLSTVVHVAALLVLWRRGQVTFRLLAAWAGLWLIGTLPYSAIVAYYLGRTGDLPFILHSATLGRYGASIDQARLVTIARGLAALLLNYPTLLGVLIIPGALALRRRCPQPLIGSVWLGVLAAQFGFALTYAVPDQYSFFVPFYAVAAALIALGAELALRRAATTIALLALAVLPAGVYAVAAPLLHERGVKFVGRTVPYRDPADFFIKPWKCGNVGQRRYVTEVLGAIPRDAVILASPTMSSMLQYAQVVERARPDVTLTTNAADLLAYLRDDRTGRDEGEMDRWTRPIFATDALASDFPRALSENCELKQTGLVWRIESPRDPARLRAELGAGTSTRR